MSGENYGKFRVKGWLSGESRCRGSETPLIDIVSVILGYHKSGSIIENKVTSNYANRK